jgi:hypothetical protein
VIDDALRRGEVSYSKVRALLRVATPANEVLLLDHARLMTASQLEKLSRKYALVQRHGQDPHPVDDEQRRYVRRRDTEDGMVKIEAVLHPEEAELIWAMLDHAATQLAHDPVPPAAELSAESQETAHACQAGVGAHLQGPAIDEIDDSMSAQVAAHAPDDMGTPVLGDTATRGCDASAESRKAAHLPGDLGSPVPQDAAMCGCNVSAESLDVIESTPGRRNSVLHRRADAARRGFSRADALVSLAQGYLRGDRPDRSPIEITLTIPEASLRADLADSVDAGEVGEMGESFVSRDTARRLSCDAGVVEVVEDEHGTPLSVGRKRRTIAGALKRALRRRDSACTYPGCTHRIFLKGHHIQHWADGGETSLNNAALLCSTHHHHVHEYGYTIELDLEQRPRFRDPHGRLVAAVPAQPTMVDLGWPWIRAMNAPLAIDAKTIACEWDGKPVPYGRVVGHLAIVDSL